MDRSRLASFAFGFCLPALASAQSPVPVILDTDFRADCDDAGALGVLHALADRAEAQILGVMISERDPWGPRGVDAINTFYGRPNLPIGQYRGNLVPEYSAYAGHLAHEFQNDEFDTPEAALLYRRILANAADHSVQVVTIGFLTNLYDLLRTPADGYSPLAGAALVQQKVAQVTMLAGGYPSHGTEFNIHAFGLWDESNSVITQLDQLGVSVTFCGVEIGQSIRTGSVIRQWADTHPIGRAYDDWLTYFAQATGRPQPDRPAWDHCAVMHAVRGLNNGLWRRVEVGSNRITSSGNSWRTTPDSNQAYLQWVNRSAGEATLRTQLQTLQRAAPVNPSLPGSLVATFEDDASDTVLPNTLGGRAKVRYGHLEFDSRQEHIVTGRRLGDQTILAEMVIASSPVFESIGFTIRATQRGGGWDVGPRVQVSKNANNRLSVQLFDRNAQGVYGPITPWNQVLTPTDTPFELRIDAVGDRVTASIDGSTVLPPTPISVVAGPTYTFVRPDFTQGGAKLDYLLLRQAGQGPAISIDRDGTTWFSEVDAGPLGPAGGNNFAVLIQGQPLDAPTWTFVLNLLAPQLSIEGGRPGSHILYGIRELPWQADSSLVLRRNGHDDGIWARRPLR